MSVTAPVVAPSSTPAQSLIAPPSTPGGGAAYPLAGRVDKATVGMAPLTQEQAARFEATRAARLATSSLPQSTRVLSGTYDDFDNVIILEVEERDQSGKSEKKTLYFEVTSLKITQGENATPQELVGAKTDAAMKKILGHMIKSFQAVDDVSALTSGADPKLADSSNITKSVTFTDDSIGFDTHNINEFGEKLLAPNGAAIKEVNNAKVLTDLLDSANWQSMLDDVRNPNHSFTFNSKVRESNANQMHTLTHQLLAKNSKGKSPYDKLPQQMEFLYQRIKLIDEHISIIKGDLNNRNLPNDDYEKVLSSLDRCLGVHDELKLILNRGKAVATFIAKHNLNTQYFSKGESFFGADLSEEWHDLLDKLGLFADLENNKGGDFFGFETSNPRADRCFGILESLHKALKSNNSSRPSSSREGNFAPDRSEEGVRTLSHEEHNPDFGNAGSFEPPLSGGLRSFQPSMGSRDLGKGEGSSASDGFAVWRNAEEDSSFVQGYPVDEVTVLESNQERGSFSQGTQTVTSTEFQSPFCDGQVEETLQGSISDGATSVQRTTSSATLEPRVESGQALRSSVSNPRVVSSSQKPQTVAHTELQPSLGSERASPRGSSSDGATSVQRTTSSATLEPRVESGQALRSSVSKPRVVSSSQKPRTVAHAELQPSLGSERASPPGSSSSLSAASAPSRRSSLAGVVSQQKGKTVRLRGDKETVRLRGHKDTSVYQPQRHENKLEGSDSYKMSIASGSQIRAKAEEKWLQSKESQLKFQ